MKSCTLKYSFFFAVTLIQVTMKHQLGGANAIVYIGLFMLLHVACKAQSAKLLVHITNIKNMQGSIRIGVYQSEKEYKKEDAAIKKIVKKVAVKNGELHVDMPVQPGVYGIALLDDENDNGKMDFRFFMPTEGYGFSNIYHEGLTMPEYKRITFTAEKDKTTKVQVKMRYF